MTDQQQTFFGDPAEERAVFGDMAVTRRPKFDAEGDYILGRVVEFEPKVDLKSGFAPVPMITFEAISGAVAGRSEPVQAGVLYAWPAMHATARNQLEDFEPEPQPGERIAIRRGREFTSTQGESTGKTLIGWQIVMPDREHKPKASEKAMSAVSADEAKATKSTKSTKSTPKPAEAGEEPF